MQQNLQTYDFRVHCNHKYDKQKKKAKPKNEISMGYGNKVKVRLTEHGQLC